MHANAQQGSPMHGTVKTITRLAYTVNDAAEQLSVSRRKMYDLMEKGEIASITVGRSRRITHEALEDYLRSLRAVA
ncbi:helix-turn-helix domain-containing protein [Actinoplanes sp. NPDC048796]|uniref:helix-turn-helix domain-containing protein n=1 Tax=Actinoplanes sp. NPDC048796 TaxID=3155640 RepID=UPI0033D8817B